MMHNVIRRSPSSTSSTVADPSTVTVRIESASTSDLNVQDVLTTSSSEDDDDDLQRRQRYPNYSGHRGPSSTLRTNHNNHSLHRHRRSGDATSSMRVPSNRPITAVSLPDKPSAIDNEWDLHSARTLASSAQRRIPSSPSTSPTKALSQSLFTPQQVPTVFTTTSECLGVELRPQPRRDPPRRSQSLAKQAMSSNNPASPTIPIVF